MEQNKQGNVHIQKNLNKPGRISKIGDVKLIVDDNTTETYANGLTVLHTSPTEFRLNFYDVSFGDEEGPVGIVKSTVIVNPSLLRKIIVALETNLKSYEDRFGKIEDPKELDKPLAEIQKMEIQDLDY